MKIFGQFVRDFRSFAGARLFGVFGLISMAALLEGLGILALLPLLSLVGEQEQTGFGRRLFDWLALAGVTSPLGQAFTISVGFVTAIGVRGWLQWNRDRDLRKLTLEYVDHWRLTAITKLSRAPWRTFVRQRKAAVEHSVLVDIARLSAGTSQTLSALVQLSILLINLTIVAVISPLLLLLVCALLAVGVVFSRPLARRSERLGASATATGRNFHKIFVEFMAAMKLTRVHDAQELYFDKAQEQLANARRWQITFTESQSAARALVQFVAALGIASVWLTGHFLLFMDVAQLAVITIVLARIASPVSSSIQTVQGVANMLPAYAQLSELVAELDHPEAEIAKPPYPSVTASDLEQPAIPRLLEVRNLWFAYRTDEWVVAEASFHIDERECVALEGPSGAGKTTMLDIVSGLMPPIAGSIYVEGRRVDTKEDWIAWRKQLAYLPQEPFLFDTTIRENLTIWAEDVSDYAMAKALDAVGARSFVEALPDGLETRAGDRGQFLSGGQRQKICLARALLQRPRLLILDEATSAIEEEGDRTFLSCLKNMAECPAILLVTHRASTQAFADRIITLPNPPNWAHSIAAPKGDNA